MKTILTPRDVADFRWNMDAPREPLTCGCVQVKALNGPYFSRLCWMHRPRIPKT